MQDHYVLGEDDVVLNVPGSGPSVGVSGPASMATCGARYKYNPSRLEFLRTD